MERRAKTTNVCVALTMGTRPHNPVLLRSCQLFAIFMWNRALATVWCTCCRPHLPKVLWSRCLWFWSGNRALATVLRTFRRQLSQIEPRTRGNRDLSRWPQEPLYLKKHRVSRPRVFSPVNSLASELLHFPTTWWWVVDMMMWLTWWCGWHDGGNADHMTIVHKLRSFLTKLPLTMATCRTPLSGTRTCDIIPQEHMLIYLINRVLIITALDFGGGMTSGISNLGTSWDS